MMSLLRAKPVKWVIVVLLVPLLDWVLSPFVLCAALLLKTIRRVGVYRMTVSRAIFFKVGVFPIRDHYYEPLFNPAHLRTPLDHDRALPGIDFNVPEQRAWLGQLSYGDELQRIPTEPTGPNRYYYHNDNFGPGDAEYFYSVIRHIKPRRIVEIGSGFSTLMARHAIAANQAQDSAYRCRHICVEPYEMAWLEQLGEVEVLRTRVEDVDRDLFRQLTANDILFIDSSHVVRPQGDVVCEYLEILPLLQSGVWVHIHDVFTPRDYPAIWVKDQIRIWNEQYLVEAFLTFNRDFRIIGALNFLRHHYPADMSRALPLLAREIEQCEPGSLWLVRN